MRRAAHIVLRATIVLTLAHAAAPARAAGATVVVVAPADLPEPLAEAVSRLRGELLSLGLQVVADVRPAARRGGAPDPRAWLQRKGGGGAPLAVIEAITAATPPAMDVWVLDRRRGTTEVSRVTLEPQVENAPGRLAIRTVEVVRSSLLAMALTARERATAAAPPPPPATTETAPPTTTVAAAPEPPAGAQASQRVAVAAGAALLTSLDAVGPALVPMGRAEWVVRPGLTLHATVAGWGTRPTISNDASAGNARVSQQYATVGACLCAPAATPLGLHLTLSAGALRTAIDGQTDAPETAHAIRRWSLLMDASVGARVRLPGPAFVVVAGHVQVAQPYLAIHFLDTQVASTGRPNLLLSLTVGAWL